MNDNLKLIQTFQVPFRYEVHFTRGLFRPENTILRDVMHTRPAARTPRVLVVLDAGVAEAHPRLPEEMVAYAEHYAADMQLVAPPMIVPGGEQVKNMPEVVDEILLATERYGIDRHSYIWIIGGGAVLDMASYAASIAHRGVRHIRIPTTVLSQNDSGIGVKNSVNRFGKKNYVGAFAPPFAVLNDAGFLRTLEDRDWRGGLSEALKVALIKDARFFEWLEANAAQLAARDGEAMEYAIFRCAELHLAHIRSGDPFEQGSSRPLDFGHWAAHKLESLTGYTLRHGEAVAIGIALDVVYSRLKAMITPAEGERILQLLVALGLDWYSPELAQHLDEPGHPRSVLTGLEEFREHLGGQLTIMLLDGIGRGREVHEMDAEVLRGAIGFLRTYEPGPLAVAGLDTDSL